MSSELISHQLTFFLLLICSLTFKTTFGLSSLKLNSGSQQNNQFNKINKTKKKLNNLQKKSN